MREVTNKEIEDKLDEVYKVGSFAFRYEDGFRSGVEWLLEEQSKPKPHVAEVVKCGQVNRFKINSLAEQLIAQGKIAKESSRIQFGNGKFEIPINNFPGTVNPSHLFRIDPERHHFGNPPQEKILICSHMGVHKPGQKGFICNKCGEWINLVNY